MGLLDRFRKREEPTQRAETQGAGGSRLREAAVAGADLDAQRELIIDILRSHGVHEGQLRALLDHTRDGVVLLESGNGSRRSRIGGPGVLAPGQDWPRGPDGTGLTLIARLCLDELPNLEPLPSGGELVIYWSEHYGEWEKLDWRVATSVRYLPEGSATEEVPAPGGVSSYPAIPLTGVLMPVVGELERVVTLGSSDNDAVYDAFEDLEPAYSHALLGSSRDVQGPVLDEVAYWFDEMFDASLAEYSEAERAGEGWMLLGQIDSTGELMFGDAGSLYLVIPSRDLAERRFDRVLGIMQCS